MRTERGLVPGRAQGAWGLKKRRYEDVASRLFEWKLSFESSEGKLESKQSQCSEFGLAALYDFVSDLYTATALYPNSGLTGIAVSVQLRRTWIAAAVIGLYNWIRRKFDLQHLNTGLEIHRKKWYTSPKVWPRICCSYWHFHYESRDEFRESWRKISFHELLQTMYFQLTSTVLKQFFSIVSRNISERVLWKTLGQKQLTITFPKPDSKTDSICIKSISHKLSKSYRLNIVLLVLKMSAR